MLRAGRGWIRAVREALGTSTAQLAKRPGDQAAVLEADAERRNEKEARS
jgi:hypothetical protein